MSEAARGQAINWWRIRSEYVSNKGHKGIRKVSLGALALKYDIPKSAILKKAGDEGWEDEREEFEKSVYEEVLRRIEKEKTSLGVMAVSTWADDLERFRSKIMDTIMVDRSEEKEDEPLTPPRSERSWGRTKIASVRLRLPWA